MLAVLDMFLEVTGASGRDLNEFIFKDGITWALLLLFGACATVVPV